MRGLCTENLIFQKFFELLQDFHDVPADAGLVNAIDTAQLNLRFALIEMLLYKRPFFFRQQCEGRFQLVQHHSADNGFRNIYRFISYKLKTVTAVISIFYRF